MGDEQTAPISGVRAAEQMGEQEWRDALAGLDPETRRQVEPLLQEYGRLYRWHQIIKMRRQAITYALDRLPLALLILDNGEITWTNRAAELLIHRHALRVKRGPTVLDALLETELLAKVEAKSREAYRLEVQGEEWQVVFHGRDRRELPVLVAICDGDGPSLAPDAEEFEVLFGLTAKEARVATLLLAGRSGREIADALEVGFETARSHVKHVLRKMGRPRQASAVLVLATSPATVGPDTRKLAAGE
ncbi:MAG: LuxR C-terminal-related transcriptional regulator [Myxococcota bacterium]